MDRLAFRRLHSRALQQVLTLAQVRPEAIVSAVLRLAQGATVPPYIKVRRRVADDLVSADFAAMDFERLTEDPAVTDVSVAYPEEPL